MFPEQKEYCPLLKVGNVCLAIDSTGQKFSLTSRNINAIVQNFKIYISNRIIKAKLIIRTFNHAGLRIIY